MKRNLNVVYVKAKENNGRYEILISTETDLIAEKVLSYYRLRFQIKFLIRDAKTHTGLEH
jgi:hypothetical protein